MNSTTGKAIVIKAQPKVQMVYTDVVQPILSDKVILRRHGNFGTPIPATAVLSPQYLEITDGYGQMLYHIELAAIQKAAPKLGGILFIYFDKKKIGLSFNSTGARFFWSNFVLVYNKKAAVWASTINQYKSQSNNAEKNEL